jgi:hypothetical protein
LRVLLVPIAELHRHLLRTLNDVSVGEDVAVVVDQEARPGRLAALLLREAEHGLGLLHDRRADEGDSLGVALVDVVDGEALVRVARRPRQRRRLSHLRGAVVVARVDDAGLDQDQARDQHDKAAGDGGPETG